MNDELMTLATERAKTDALVRELLADNERLAAEAALGPIPISHEWPACGCKITPSALCDDAHHWVFKVECAESERDEARAEVERLTSRLRELLAENEKLTTISDALLSHCPDSECSTCAKIACPHGEPLHFHHDGCPSCYTPESHPLHPNAIIRRPAF